MLILTHFAAFCFGAAVSFVLTALVAAKARGQKFGRPTVWKWEQYINVFERYIHGEMSQEQARREISPELSNRSFYKMYHKFKNSISCEMEVEE